METRAKPHFNWPWPVTITAACGMLTFVSCQQPPPPPPAPATNWSGGLAHGSNLIATVGATVNPVGPPRWCYTVESFDLSQTNMPGAPDTGTPMPDNPHGHPDGISFTNLEVSASHCSIANVPPGWIVQAGSSFVLTATNGFGSSKLTFCLECDATNGTVTLKLTDRQGDQVMVGPLAGPQ